MINESKYYKRINDLHRQHFTGEVPFYSSAELRPVEKILLSSFTKEAKLLDLACGSGRFSIGAAKMGFNVLGVDITPKTVEAAQTRARSLKLSNASFRIGDMSELDLKDSAFDYVVCPRFSINAISVFSRRLRAVKEMLRVVKPGGKVYIESFNRWYIGRGLIIPAKLYIIDLLRNAQILTKKVMSSEYEGLMPGDLIYPANKVKGATEGYTHLPSVIEIRRWIPRGSSYNFYSIPQMIRPQKFDLFKYFRYSIWLVIEK